LSAACVGASQAVDKTNPNAANPCFLKNIATPVSFGFRLLRHFVATLYGNGGRAVAFGAGFQ
ncbi:MAG: hypothetical protein ACK4N6_07470, partial [Rhodocyclaceae bacterium]